jgi:hypothetical protein
MAGKSDYNKMKARFAEVKNRKADMDDDKWWKAEAPQSSSGNPITHRIRILPPPDGFNFWYLEYGVHYRLKNEDGSNVSATCPLKTLKQRCPVCEFTKGLWKSGTEADQNLARDIGSKTRFCSNLVVLGKGQELFKGNEPKLWSYGPKVWTPLNELCVGESGEIVPIDDPDHGYNIKIVVSTKSSGTENFPEYTVMPELKPCAIPDKNVLNKLYPMHELIRSKVKSFDELRTILMGAGSSEQPPPPAPSQEDVIADAPVPDATTTVIEENEEEVIVSTQEKSHGKAEGSAQVARPSQDELIKRARAALQKRSAQ